MSFCFLVVSAAPFHGSGGLKSGKQLELWGDITPLSHSSSPSSEGMGVGDLVVQNLEEATVLDTIRVLPAILALHLVWDMECVVLSVFFCPGCL